MQVRNLVKALTNTEAAEVLESLADTHNLPALKEIANQARERFVKKFDVLTDFEKKLAYTNHFECVKSYVERTKVPNHVAKEIMKHYLYTNPTPPPGVETQKKNAPEAHKQ